MTVPTKRSFLTCAIDAYKSRDVMSLDIPNAFIQTGMPQTENNKRTIMKIRGKLVNWLVDLYPTSYLNMVVVERGVKVIYVEMLRAICGMPKALLLWYRKFHGNLEKNSFVFNNCDPCIA